jgi:hypothetical protein
MKYSIHQEMRKLTKNTNRRENAIIIRIVVVYVSPILKSTSGTSHAGSNGRTCNGTNFSYISCNISINIQVIGKPTRVEHRFDMDTLFRSTEFSTLGKYLCIILYSMKITGIRVIINVGSIIVIVGMPVLASAS